MARRSKNTFRISGRVIDRQNKQGIAGLRVEAWDKDLLVDDLVGSAVTDENGAFRIEFEASHFKELFFDRKPDLFFKIFRDERLIKSTEDSVLWNVKAGDTELVIEVDLPGQPEHQFIVRGQVRQADGSVVSGRVVRAFDRDLRHEELLGEARTDETGHYVIRYGHEQFLRAEKGSADIVVRVVSTNDSLLSQSPTLDRHDAQHDRHPARGYPLAGQ